jgi:hypothetical protein
MGRARTPIQKAIIRQVRALDRLFVGMRGQLDLLDREMKKCAAMLADVQRKLALLQEEDRQPGNVPTAWKRAATHEASPYRH